MNDTKIKLAMSVFNFGQTLVEAGLQMITTALSIIDKNTKSNQQE